MPSGDGALAGHQVALSFHHRLLTDPTRMRAYHRAIADAIGPDDVVLDLGTGSGVLALWAAQAGARHVYAVEPQQESLEDRFLSLLGQ